MLGRAIAFVRGRRGAAYILAVPVLVAAIAGLALLLHTARPSAGPDPSGISGSAPASTHAVARGKRIYTQGRSPRHAPLAATVLGTPAVPASRYPCLRCHGADGRGKWEGGIHIPEIRWPRLRTAATATGTRTPPRPAYTPATLARAIRRGHSPTGRPLDALMPRYTIGDQDLADLTAYLRQLGTEHAPGTSATTIRVGVLLPLAGPMAAQSAAVRAVLDRHAARINAAGGIYGRTLELAVRDAGATEQQAVQAAEHMLAHDGGVLCFLAGGGPGASPAVQTLLARRQIPSIGPLTFNTADSARGSVFYLLGSLADQARAAARHLARRQDTAPIALVTTAHPRARHMAAAFREEARRAGLAVSDAGVVVRDAMRTHVARLRAGGSRGIVFWGDAATARMLLDEAARQQWTPNVLASSILLGGTIDIAHGPLHLVAPPLGPGLFRPGRARFQPAGGAGGAGPCHADGRVRRSRGPHRGPGDDRARAEPPSPRPRARAPAPLPQRRDAADHVRSRPAARRARRPDHRARPERTNPRHALARIAVSSHPSAPHRPSRPTTSRAGARRRTPSTLRPVQVSWLHP